MNFMKKTLQLMIIAAGVILLAACQSKKDSEEMTYDFKMEAKEVEVNDPHTLSNYEDVALKHLQWDAVVDFENEKIQADATWTIDNFTNSDVLVLDTKHLEIQNVVLNSSQKTQFELLEGKELYGRPLQIEIFPDTETVTITYNTTKESSAIQWLSPQQTDSETDPFLFTQSQSILARTWLPSMDGPGFRFTYKANVQVPEGLMALMSADNPKFVSNNGNYQFEMDQPIPAYLFSLAVGKLEYERIGEQSGVYAEPTVIKEAAQEFSDLPKMIKAAENLYGSYRWEEYDIIVLPPSFPFGGMEHPRLTFATPTIIAGDKSLTSLVAHELAHSWSGNLVTNANWNDFWLNEGFTVYFEQRIMEAIYGREYSEMLASLSYEGLKSDLEEMSEEDTRLRIDLENRDPDEGLTSIPYDKGYLFLRHIEETIGRENFDQFLRNYFDTYGFKVMNTETFVELVEDKIIQDNEELAEELALEEWIHQPGLPENHPVPVSDNFAQVRELTDPVQVDQIRSASKDWSSHEWQHFIESLPNDISLETMAELDEAFGFTQSGNSEIQFDWYKLAIEQGYEDAYPAIEEFLIRVGRRKFLRPLYQTMVDEDMKDWALEIYEQARPNYHSVSFNTIDDILDYEA